MQRTRHLLLGLLAAVLAAAPPAVAQMGAQASPYTLVNPPGSPMLMPMPYGPVAHPGAASAVWTNPAGLSWNGGTKALFGWSSSMDTESNIYGSDFGLAISLDGLAFGWENVDGGNAQRYTVGLGGEVEPGFHLGTAYHWSSGIARENAWDVGVLVRPWRWLSVGGTAWNAIGGDMAGTEVNPIYQLGLALRPLGSRITVTADATLWESPTNDYGENLNPTFTAEVEALEGVFLRGGYALDSEVAFGGLGLAFGTSEVAHYHGFAGDAASGPEDAGFGHLAGSSDWSPSFLDGLLPKHVVKITLNGQLVEEPSGFSFFFPQRRTLLETIEVLERVRRDERIAGVLIEYKGLSSGLSDLVELRDAIKRVRAAGKEVVFYAHSLGMGGFFLASAADEVVLYPAGDITAPGINAESPFARRLLEKIHVQAQFLTVGKYKSAAETFTRDSYSEPAREAMNALLDDLWELWLDEVAEGRSSDRGTVATWVDSALHTARDAEKLGLVDRLAYPDEVEEIVKETTGSKKIVTEKQYKMMEIAPREWPALSTPRIALIYATGPIVTGKSQSASPFGDAVMGSETIARAIRAARKDGRVKAIVLRVDSPGGSALASDIIAREIERTVAPEDEDERRVPVIVSMSDVAASGGYYIAAMADTIFALPSTITGSIGVVGGRFSFEPLADTLGVDFDAIRRGENADLFGVGPWNEEQKRIVYKSMASVYDDFTGVVAEGRGLERSRVHELGQGRVWSGDDALERELVDVHGGLYEALEMARELSGADRYQQSQVKILPGLAGGMMLDDLQALFGPELPPEIRKLLERQRQAESFQEEPVQLVAPVDRESVILE